MSNFKNSVIEKVDNKLKYMKSADAIFLKEHWQ